MDEVRSADVFNALGAPVRVAIVDELITHHAQTLFELVLRLSNDRGVTLSRQAISKHLAVLEDARIVRITRVGRTSVHAIDGTRLAEAREWLAVRLDHLGSRSSHSLSTQIHERKDR